MKKNQQKIECKQAQTNKKQGATDHVYQWQRYSSHGEDSGKPMRNSHFLRVYFPDQSPAFAKIENLFKKLEKAGSALVENKCFGDEANAKPRFFHPYAELNIFGKPIKSKTLCNLEDFLWDAHIETPGLEPSDTLFSSAYATRC